VEGRLAEPSFPGHFPPNSLPLRACRNCRAAPELTKRHWMACPQVPQPLTHPVGEGPRLPSRGSCFWECEVGRSAMEKMSDAGRHGRGRFKGLAQVQELMFVR
jgi:hypothetical protein